MKTFLAILILSAAAWAQAPTTPASKAGAAPSATPATAAKPATQQGAAPAAAAVAAAPVKPATPANTKPLPQAKTQDEITAYNAAAGAADPAAAEAAAADFVTKFPQSELRGMLYSNILRMYQGANNADKTVEMGRKVLQYDAGNPVALVMTASVLAERTRDSDLDKDERLAEAVSDAEKAIQTADTELMVPPSATPEQVESAKLLLKSMAHAALGSVEMTKKNPAKAEEHFKEAVRMGSAQPDSVTWLRLSLAQDAQKKYAEALASATKAMEYSAQDPSVSALAKQEHDRLVKLTGSGGAAGSTAAAATPSSGAATTTAPPSSTATSPSTPSMSGTKKTTTPAPATTPKKPGSPQ